jgi:hypothetical protein
MAEQWAFNPLVQGSTPWRPTWENVPFRRSGVARIVYTQPLCRAVAAEAKGGYIQQLPSGSFRVSVYAGTDPLTGRQIRLGRTCKTERAAQIELSKVPEQADPGRQPETDATVAQLVDRYAEVADCDLSTRKAGQRGLHPPGDQARPGAPAGPRHTGTPARFAQRAAEALCRPYVHR